MADIGVNVTGTLKIERLFDEFPAEAQAAIAQVIGEQVSELAATVRAAAPRRSGKMASEVTGSVSSSAERIVGRVFFDAADKSEYGKIAALEYGAHHPVKVSAHEMRLTHAWGHLIGAETVEVPEHSRTPNIAEHRFLRDSLEALQAQIADALDRILALD